MIPAIERARPGGRREGPASALDEDARRAAGGDLQAFERFHRATLARVYSLARRLLGRERADEAVQEIYLGAWRGLTSWRGEAGAATWLQRLALHRLLNELARRVPLDASGDGAAALARRPARSERTAERLDLEAAIERLPDGARAIFVLHDVEGFTHDEIAARLALSPGTSKSQLHRARLLLRAALGEEACHE